MKKVSIVIPTRNRAHLLQYALKSAVEQDYKDLEVIVCDNFSTDDTKRLVSSFKNKNIIYVRTSQPLCMSDNWEFALSKANGEYVTFLTDPSYLLYQAISIIMEEIKKFDLKLAVWKNSIYFYPKWIEKGRSNNLYIPKVTGTSFILDSKKILKKCFDNVSSCKDVMPRAMNSLCHRSVIDKIISTQGRFFWPANPDYSSGISVLFETEKYLVIDKPLYVASVSQVNNASSAFVPRKDFRDLLKKSDDKLDDIAFLGILVVPATIAKNYKDIRKFYPDNSPELNIKNILSEIVDSIMKLEVYGGKAPFVENCWQKLNNYVIKQNNKIKFTIKKQILFSKLKWIIIKMIRSSFFLYRFEFLRNMYILKGNKYNFYNIEQATKIINK